MLSYRHVYHAGNFGDVIKHIVLVEILRHLIKKEKPFDYIDTHAGAGLYRLDSSQAQKNREFEAGIHQLYSVTWPELEPYLKCVKLANQGQALKVYPGSPYLASQFLRRQDKGWLFELHPKDYPLLNQQFRPNKNIRVQSTDGFQGLHALLPPQSRRGVVLIDPSYEIKGDYQRVVQSVISSYKKFSTGIYAIWYPVVDRSTIQNVEGRLIRSGIRNIQLFELALEQDNKERGMTASGMIVINPPWTLKETLSSLLPQLIDRLARNDRAFYRCEQLVDE